MPTFGWDSQRQPKENEKDEQQPSVKAQEEDHKPTEPDASTIKTDSAEQEPPKLSFDPNRLNFPSTFDSDKKEHIPSFNFPNIAADRAAESPAHLSMPHRVDPYPMTSSHRRHYEPYDHRRPSPPPITTLTHSPSPSVSSLDRSAVSTPPVRRSPPHGMPAPNLYATHYPPDPAMLNSRQHHFSRPGEGMSHGYMYSTHPPPPPPLDPRYDSHEGVYHGSPHLNVPIMHAHPPPPPHVRDGYAPLGHGHAHAGHPYPHPGQQNISIVHTDDAATKLSDRVRRRCFNCCTTDTSTWRRSNLSPGKVLCNKCGLFERTHSRPRPEQFPHKRGPLASSTLRSRTPPQTQLPPISPPPPFHYSHPPPPRDYGPPPTSNHNASGTTLPGLPSWHHPPPPPPGQGQGQGQGQAQGQGETGPGQSPHMQPPPLPPAPQRRGTLGAGSRPPSPPPLRPSSAHGQQQQQQQQEAREQQPVAASAAAA